MGTPTRAALLRRDLEPLMLEIWRECICGLSSGYFPGLWERWGLEYGIGTILRVESLKESLEAWIRVDI